MDSISAQIKEILGGVQLHQRTVSDFQYPLLVCGEIEKIHQLIGSLDSAQQIAIRTSLLNIASGVPNLFRDCFLFLEHGGRYFDQTKKQEIMSLAGSLITMLV